MFRVGDKVIAKIDMLNDLTDIGGPPNACYALRGEELIIRKVHNEKNFSVSYEDILDNSFGVTLDEIELVVNA